MLRSLSFGFVTALGLGVPVAAETSALALPDIEIVADGAMLNIAGRVVGLADGTVTATLAIEKADGGGRMHTSQRRDIIVSPGSSDAVALTSVSVQAGLSLSVTLTLTVGDAVVGSTSLAVGQLAD